MEKLESPSKKKQSTKLFYTKVGGLYDQSTYKLQNFNNIMVWEHSNLFVFSFNNEKTKREVKFFYHS